MMAANLVQLPTSTSKLITAWAALRPGNQSPEPRWLLILMSRTLIIGSVTGKRAWRKRSRVAALQLVLAEIAYGEVFRSSDPRGLKAVNRKPRRGASRLLIRILKVWKWGRQSQTEGRDCIETQLIELWRVNSPAAPMLQKEWTRWPDLSYCRGEDSYYLRRKIMISSIELLGPPDQIKVQPKLQGGSFTLTDLVTIFSESNRRWSVVSIAPQGIILLQKRYRDYAKQVLCKPSHMLINVSTEASAHF